MNILELQVEAIYTFTQNHFKTEKHLNLGGYSLSTFNVKSSVSGHLIRKSLYDIERIAQLQLILFLQLSLTDLPFAWPFPTNEGLSG